MNTGLFKVFVVLSAAIFLLMTENESFAARGGGGRDGGGGGGRGGGGGHAVSRSSGGGAGDGWVEWEEGDARAGVGPRYRAEAMAAADPGRYPDLIVIEQAVWLRTRMWLVAISTGPKRLPKFNLVRKVRGPLCPSVAQGKKPGTGAGGNKGFPDIADKTGSGQLAGKAQGAKGGQLAGKVQGPQGGQLAGKVQA